MCSDCASAQSDLSLCWALMQSCRKCYAQLVHVCFIIVLQARSHLMSMRTCFYFMLCCSLSLSLTQLLASTLLFPPVLAPQHVLWLILFVIPLLGFTMIGNPVDARVMTLATKKNKDHITSEVSEKKKALSICWNVTKQWWWWFGVLCPFQHYLTHI